MALENEIDANFFNLIHQLVGTPEEDERRSHPRQPFQSVQRIAVRRGPGIPDESEFIEVRCHDLTRAGFSFLLPSQPDFADLVAAFGTPPDVMYVGAHVSRCKDVSVDSSGRVEKQQHRAGHFGHETAVEHIGTSMILVGCKFTERLKG